MIKSRVLAMCVILSAGTCLGVATTEPTPLAANSPEGSPVTLHLNNATLDSVLATIARQTGIRVTSQQMQYQSGWGQSNTPATVTLDVDNRPFWEVLGEICQQTQTNLQIDQTGNLVLSPGMQNQGQVYVAGPVRLNASAVEHRHVFTRPGGMGEFCAVRVEMLWEPRLNAVYFRDDAPPDAAVDENGVSLVPAAGAALDDPRNNGDPTDPNRFIRYVNEQPNSTSQMYIPLAVSEKSGRRIISISGKLQFYVAEKFESLDVPATNSRTRDLHLLNNGMDVAVQPQGGNAAQVTIVRNGADADKWQALQRDFQAAYVTGVNQSGTTVRAWHGGGGWGGDERSSYFYFQQGPVTQMKAEFPDNITEADVPYKFTALPLP